MGSCDNDGGDGDSDCSDGGDNDDSDSDDNDDDQGNCNSNCDDDMVCFDNITECFKRLAWLRKGRQPFDGAMFKVNEAIASVRLALQWALFRPVHVGLLLDASSRGLRCAQECGTHMSKLRGYKNVQATQRVLRLS